MPKNCLVFEVSYSKYTLGFCLTSEAYDALDPNGNITIKWDVISWTPDGYVVRTPILLHYFITSLES